jgi:hypothetical protein
MKIGQRIVWNQQVQRDRTFLNNKPDIIISFLKEETCTLIDVAISGDRNLVKTAAEEILKYKDLTIEIQRMWNVINKGNPFNKRGK